MFCSNCGKEHNGAFCPQCGTPASAQVTNNNEDEFDKTVSAVGTPPVANTQPQFYKPQPSPQPQYQPQQPQYQQQQPQYQQPQYKTQFQGSESVANISMMDAVKRFFKNYTNFAGRATVREYWLVFAFNIIISLATSALSLIPVIGIIFTILAIIYSLATIIPGLALAWRRLHDSGKSGVYILMSLIPIAGFIILLVYFCSESVADNEYGPRPY